MQKKIALTLIIVSAITVVAGLGIGYFLQPELVAKRNFVFLAKDYYENYYYQQMLGDKDDPAGVFDYYKEIGLPSVKLYQLLMGNDAKHASMRSSFTENGYVCDLDQTSVKYYPVAPYGVTDYAVKYNYSCIDE